MSGGWTGLMIQCLLECLGDSVSGCEGRGHGSYGTLVVEMIEALKACLLGACRNVAFNWGRKESQRWDPNIL